MLVLFGYISRMARAGTVESLHSNYVRTAILKGLPRRQVIARHVLRNALLPTISVVSVQVGYLVGGLVVIETLFSYPGIGKLVLDSAVGHDLPVLEATVLTVAVLYMVSNLVADVLYAVLNPRIRLAS
jgi:peptide/nickel transport system permease protein